MSGGIINLALSSLCVGQGLTLSGSTLSATPGVSVKATRNASSSSPVTADDYYVGYTGGAGSTFTLTAAAANAGVEIIIKNRGSAALTLATIDSGGFYGTSVVTTWSLVAGEGIHLVSDGVIWVIVGFASGIIT